MIEIVAELSCNHKGSLQNALDLIQAANDAGCDAVKLQTFEPDGIAVDMVLPDGTWEGKRLSKLYEEAYTPWEWTDALFDRAWQLNMGIFSTAASVKAVEFLDSRNCPRFKVASFEIGHHDLLTAIASTGKPVVISTGMATDIEIQAALAHFDDEHDVTLLHCISGYPTPVAEANLWRIDRLKREFQVPVGFSDHTNRTTTGAYAVAAGAWMLEKHLKLRDISTLDDAFSLDPAHMREYVEFARDAERAMQISTPTCELPSLIVKKARREAHRK